MRDRTKKWLVVVVAVVAITATVAATTERAARVPCADEMAVLASVATIGSGWNQIEGARDFYEEARAAFEACWAAR